jgi:hypothetical protein
VHNDTAIRASSLRLSNSSMRTKSVLVLLFKKNLWPLPCSRRGSLCRNATLVLLPVRGWNRTPALLERRTRAGHRSLKQGQLEVVGRGRPLLRPKGGPTIKASGGNCALEAQILPDICHVLIEAGRLGVLGKRAERLAERAALLQLGFATLGIVALVDEVTGYQRDRAANALALILEKFHRQGTSAMGANVLERIL